MLKTHPKNANKKKREYRERAKQNLKARSYCKAKGILDANLSNSITIREILIKKKKKE